MTYDEALTRFIKLCQERSDAHFAKELPYSTPQKFGFIHGRKYDKVITLNPERGAYCWIDRANGNIMKGSWKRIEHWTPRGNIYNDDPLQGTNLYGVDYLKLDNSQWK